MNTRALFVLTCLALTSCRRPSPTGESAPREEGSASTAASPNVASPNAAAPRPSACGSAGGGPKCMRFDSPAAAFQWVLAKQPRILAVGEAHAQRGTESITSTTKRFTDTLLPLVAPKASDIVVELWAPDPSCAKEVKQVASAQKPVTEAQAETNQNEYVALGTAAKGLGMTPWLLRPSCDDFARIADAGADAVSAMLGTVKRLTQGKVTMLFARGQADPVQKTILAYGGALHNDLNPPEATAEYSFGPDLDRFTGGRYVELDLIVPEYVKKSPVWEKLPWYASFEADRASGKATQTTLYELADRSYVLIFPSSK